MDFNVLKNIDATIVVAVITFLGTWLGMIYTRKSQKEDKNFEILNKNLQHSWEEIKNLQEQHAIESQKLEQKIMALTAENQELRREVVKLNNYLIKLGITI